MFSQSKIAKLTAKSVFKNKWVKMLAIGTILTFCILAIFPFFVLSYYYFSFSVTVAFITAFSLLWVAPVALGTLRTLCREVATGESEIMEIFYYFSSFYLYKKTITFLSVLIFKVCTVLIICLAPSFVLSFVNDASLQELAGFSLPIWLSGLHVLSSLFAVIGIVVSIFINIRFFAAPFLFVSDDNCEVLEVLKNAVRLSKTGYLEFLSLMGSFVLWFLLSLFIFVLPFVLPYFFTCVIILCRFTLYQYNKKCKRNTFEEVKV